MNLFIHKNQIKKLKYLFSVKIIYHLILKLHFLDWYQIKDFKRLLDINWIKVKILMINLLRNLKIVLTKINVRRQYMFKICFETWVRNKHI